MTPAAKAIFFAGLALTASGLLLLACGRLGFRGLPGDIAYQSPSGRFRFYFPIVTALLLSLLLTLASWLWFWLRR